ncbi:hypothetical protein SAMN05421504_104593 [Amycolatopsis xylanica]|uniref:Uncharacterized protein n=1 Tax=Amycolatopsis xylanica TaxID=589385 RepID=A0A1H3HB43_9PSEU|nr:hypothetical protein [Amycolatopsis xylanica]SDY12701.1 hypothetical protein SAMN05421504_104593 [Amycolatopsis xylanica]
MVHVPRDKVLEDPFADLDPDVRDWVYRSERRLIKYLDRLTRRQES